MLTHSLNGQETLVFYIMQTHFKGNDSLSVSQSTGKLDTPPPSPPWLQRLMQTKVWLAHLRSKLFLLPYRDFYFIKSI